MSPSSSEEWCSQCTRCAVAHLFGVAHIGAARFIAFGVLIAKVIAAQPRHSEALTDQFSPFSAKRFSEEFNGWLFRTVATIAPALRFHAKSHERHNDASKPLHPADRNTQMMFPADLASDRTRPLIRRALRPTLVRDVPHDLSFHAVLDRRICSLLELGFHWCGICSC
jgi:hypothetical protein